MAPGRAPSGGSICTGASHGPVCLPVALSFHLDAQFLKRALSSLCRLWALAVSSCCSHWPFSWQRQPVAVLYPVMTGCSCLETEKILLLLLFFTLSQNMRLEFSFAREVLASCVHVVGTWARSRYLGPELSAPLSVRRAYELACFRGPTENQSFGHRHVRSVGRHRRLS